MFKEHDHAATAIVLERELAKVGPVREVDGLQSCYMVRERRFILLSRQMRDTEKVRRRIVVPVKEGSDPELLSDEVEVLLRSHKGDLSFFLSPSSFLLGDFS
ncbi:hypothetical protein EM20IM_06075 [Candidatus Methylacidiphilum infernorum]|uniref:Uncharacterized protein n=1 Tax=Candidatus Methylacidiphilum infernorum TaxID=511746 RepID=A0ABX7PTR8_9BACT|nr:hypothetical protein [Candidatus Methylacidiphilum infernorum]QSR86078.1 hypothetical protein EM20IM_06075 [Candidatus Methylacidiphilum infernorum]